MRERIVAAAKVFAFFTAGGLLLFAYRYLETIATRHPVSPVGPLVDQLVTGSWMAALLYPLVARFARRFPLSAHKWYQRIPLHASAVLVYSAAHTSLLWASRSVLYPLLGLGAYDYGRMSVRYPMELSIDVITYALMVSIVHLLDRHVRAAQLEAQLSQAELENLRLQLQPHFLFNALNAISSLMYEHPRKADAMIARLSNLLRATLSASHRQVVPLAEELELLDLYLEVMRLRFEDQLQVQLRVQPEVRDALVPHLVLQPLVENSIRHGEDPQSRTVTVQISAERLNGSTQLRVRDWGPGAAEAGIRKGTGLANTSERLQQLYGSEHRLDFENCTDGGLLVTVAFPYRT
ncbi:MAG TPA: histidine kinase [Bryobacteraceae bacterium]|nr:histidine kinase [Bryobacteraceae bacterium]